MPSAIPEVEVLRPRDPSAEDSDDWNEFTLTKAFVHATDDKRDLVSLLVAEAGHPVTVVGELEPLDEDEYDLYLHKPKTEPKRAKVELHDVRQFAFGEDDGQSAIWAAGKAGWHRLHPARKYEKIYREMCEAVQMLYYIVDAYKTERYEGKGKNKTLLKEYSAQEIFENYARDVLEVDDVEQGSTRVYKHKDFLISSMLAGREGLAWTKYPLCKHLYKRFPDTVAMLRKRREAPAEHQIPASKTRNSRKNDAESSSAPLQQSRTRLTRQTSVDTDLVTRARAEPGKARTTRQCSAEAGSSGATVKRKRGRPAKQAMSETASHDSASEASDAISAEPELEETQEDDEPVMGPPKTRPGRNTRRNPEPVVLEILATPAKEEESDEEIRAREQKNKSSLRPRASKASKSAARNGGKGPEQQDDSSDDEPDPPSSPIPGKRKNEDHLEDLQRRWPKRRSSRPHDDEGIDIPTSPDSSGGDIDLPLGLTEVASVHAVQEDTWVCALDRCTHKVHASSHPESQRLIREHYALHAYDDDERVQMVKKVEAPSLPVGRLMEKVKMQAKAEGFPGSHAAAPSMPDNVRSRFAPVGHSGVVQKH
ncbi:hypothetical protein CERZMDRAFT_95926 [Cercospora zeae-maydis SCOH1-5]|uniref:DNA (cytosine-5)-methyltransferase 1 replication foci domain-containing protein n=1 Tax=Cercospora zeae-maydis SCOH1-5 TaxID=717836 RepID=A0A6A6FKZ9_9PEZI|nr:hypothetical protein CERZMDRAFT_95926 [Cercospora zeae-maydis SCOH1-5]